jgi:predicted DNA-binding protein
MKKRIHSMTLRLSPEIAEAVENRAYERGCSQADWIRRAIRRALVEEHENEMRKLGSAPNMSDSLGKR